MGPLRILTACERVYGFERLTMHTVGPATDLNRLQACVPTEFNCLTMLTMAQLIGDRCLLVVGGWVLLQ